MKLKETRPLYKLMEVSEILRSENGCAWDREQTSQSLKPHLIEEAYELYDAIDRDNPDELQEELGDVLYQVFAHSQIADEAERFNIDDVAQGIVDKLVYRHPHVFGDDTIDNADDVIIKWEQLKQKEKKHRESILDGVPAHLPGLIKAYRMQEKTARVGFDWETVDQPIEKLDEEMAELKEAVKNKNRDELFEEAGDILFTVVNIFRFLKISPEEALQQTNNKFMTRFKYIEKRAREEGRNLEDMTLKEMDGLWTESKDQINNT